MPRAAKNTLSGLVVSQAMRRQVIEKSQRSPIANSINALIKYKINALLATDEEGRPSGVLSKTDVMGAYYAGLPIDTPIEDIMSSPPLFCRPDHALDHALQIMRTNGIYRLYVVDPDSRRVVGALAYPDIVGLLYQYCRSCEQSHFKKKSGSGGDPIKRFRVREVMTPGVKDVSKKNSLATVMEELSIYRFGAILVTDGKDRPCGVISKTDLALAYKHGVDAQVAAETVMSSPVLQCSAEDLLEDAIRKMIFTDIHRLFVHGPNADELVGVFSLSDAARIRSGSCHACVSSRIQIET
jgi:CBS domain-containing protein